MLVLAAAAVGTTRADDAPPHRRYGAWTSCPIGGGGFLQGVHFATSDTNRVYMLSDVGGFFRSDDAGLTWRMLHGSLPPDAGAYSPRGLSVHPRHADRILVALGSRWGRLKGVFLSEDGGLSWRQTLAAPFEGNGDHRGAGNVVVASPHDPNLVLAGSLGGGIRRSTDGGLTWTALPPDDLSPTHIHFDRADSNRVWLCALPWADMPFTRRDGTPGHGLRGGLHVSRDAGRTWTLASAESPSEFVQDPQDPGVLYGIVRPKQVVRSRDGGFTWERHSEGLAPFDNGDARRDGTYEALAAGPDFLLAGGHGGHFYRLDGERRAWREVRWERVEEGDWWGRMRPDQYRHFGSALCHVGVSPHDPRHWVFTDWYACYRSRDAGRSWQLAIDGVEMTVVHSVAQQPGASNGFHVGTADVGYFRSSDGGRTMTWNNRGISNNIKCLAPSRTQPGRLYAVGPAEWQWHANALFVSDDEGATWRRASMQGLPDMERRRCNTVVAHPARPDEVWLAVSGPVKPGDGGPWCSRDGGTTWQWRGEGLPAVDAFYRQDIWVAGPELAISADGSMVTISDDKGHVARREAGGANWTPLSRPDGAFNCVAADPLVAGRFYVACQQGGLWRSEDGGVSWMNVIDRDVHWVAPDWHARDRIAAVRPDGVLVSGDAGETWRPLDRSLPYRHGRNVVCFAGEQVVVGTGGNGVFRAPLTSLSGTPKRLARAAP